MSETNKDGVVVAVIAVVFLAIGGLGGWFARSMRAQKEAAEWQTQLTKVVADGAAYQERADSAVAASAQLEKKYKELAAQDNADTVYLQAHEKWAHNPSADSVRRFLGTRPDGLIRRWYPGKRPIDPSTPQ